MAAPAVDADARRRGYTFAVVGDIPYTPAQEAQFPAWVDQINADRAVRLAVHLGDIKSGSTVCSDEYFAKIRAEFDRFRDPLVYTPGDQGRRQPGHGADDPGRHVRPDQPGPDVRRLLRLPADRRRHRP